MDLDQGPTRRGSLKGPRSGGGVQASAPSLRHWRIYGSGQLHAGIRREQRCHRRQQRSRSRRRSSSSREREWRQLQPRRLEKEARERVIGSKIA